MEVMDQVAFEEIRAQRREMAAQTMRAASSAELQATVAQIFAGRASHPWYQTCMDFLAEHATERALRGELPENHAFIYFPKSNKGLWYKASPEFEAVGVISGPSLTTLGEIAAAKNLTS